MNLFKVLSFLLFLNAIYCAQLSYRDCGPSDRSIKYNAVKIDPYPILYPGSLKLSVDMEVVNDIPTEHLKAKITAEKLTPMRMLIPCIGDLGSCTYDYCDYSQKNTNDLFNHFGPGKCPVKSGKHSFDNSEAVLPNFGPVFEKVMEGDFEANATYFDSQTNKIYGCIHVQFTVQLKSVA